MRAAGGGPPLRRTSLGGTVRHPSATCCPYGGGGLRKLRWGTAGRGKRGGLRVIYYWAPREATVYMLYLYAKNEQGDLTPAQVRVLARLVREEFR